MSSAERQTSPITPIVIFDFDGTIIAVDSFHYWITAMFMERLGGISWPKRLLLSFRTAKIMFENALGRKSRFEAKQHLQTLWNNAVKKDEDKVAARGLRNALGGKIRKNMRSALSIVAQGTDSIFASAAAAAYARDFAETVGFKYILATEPDGRENYGDEKRDRVLTLLKEKGWSDRRRIFVTAHEEDVPLIAESHLVLWFGEDMAVPSVKERVPQVEILACRDRSGDEIKNILFPAG